MSTYRFPPGSDMHYIQTNFPEYIGKHGGIDSSKFPTGADAAKFFTEKVKGRDAQARPRGRRDTQSK